MKYSIITINYNNKRGLFDTMNSIINQSCNDYEYIIIDGGSTDGSTDVIKEYEKHNMDDFSKIIEEGVDSSLLYTKPSIL